MSVPERGLARLEGRELDRSEVRQRGLIELLALVRNLRGGSKVFADDLNLLGPEATCVAGEKGLLETLTPGGNDEGGDGSEGAEAVDVSIGEGDVGASGKRGVRGKDSGIEQGRA